MAERAAGERRGPRRVLLGTRQGYHTRERVYATRDALEIDDVEGSDVTRRRVFYDDVVLVTRHRQYGWVFLSVTLALAIGVGFIVGPLRTPTVGLAVVMYALFGLPFLLSFVIRALFGVEVICVQGRRTKAVMHFQARRRRAIRVFEQVCRSARQAQGAAAGR